MARFCTNCGKEIADGIAFCTECGARAPEAAQQVEPMSTAAAVQTAPPPVQTYAPPVQTADTNESKTVSTGYYFGMMFVYSIPLIGWIICLISAFAGKNQSKKHFARAILIWALIGIVLSVIAGIVFSLIGGAFTDYINDMGLF